MFEREDVNAILSGIFDLNVTLSSIDSKLEMLVNWLDIGGDDEEEEDGPWRRSPEDIERHEQTLKLLSDRIAYHRAKIEEEREQREREAS